MLKMIVNSASILQHYIRKPRKVCTHCKDATGHYGSLTNKHNLVIVDNLLHKHAVPVNSIVTGTHLDSRTYLSAPFLSVVRSMVINF